MYKLVKDDRNCIRILATAVKQFPEDQTFRQLLRMVKMRVLRESSVRGRMKADYLNGRDKLRSMTFNNNARNDVLETKLQPRPPTSHILRLSDSSKTPRGTQRPKTSRRYSGPKIAGTSRPISAYSMRISKPYRPRSPTSPSYMSSYHASKRAQRFDFLSNTSPRAVTADPKTPENSNTTPRPSPSRFIGKTPPSHRSATIRPMTAPHAVPSPNASSGSNVSPRRNPFAIASTQSRHGTSHASRKKEPPAMPEIYPAAVEHCGIEDQATDERPRVVFLTGAPMSGKSSQLSFVSRHPDLNWTCLNMTELMDQQRKMELSKPHKRLLAISSSHKVVLVLYEKIRELCDEGFCYFLVDGFPGTLKQWNLWSHACARARADPDDPIDIMYDVNIHLNASKSTVEERVLVSSGLRPEDERQIVAVLKNFQNKQTLYRNLFQPAISAIPGKVVLNANWDHGHVFTQVYEVLYALQPKPKSKKGFLPEVVPIIAVVGGPGCRADLQCELLEQTTGATHLRYDDQHRNAESDVFHRMIEKLTSDVVERVEMEGHQRLFVVDGLPSTRGQWQVVKGVLENFRSQEKFADFSKKMRLMWLNVVLSSPTSRSRGNTNRRFTFERNQRHSELAMYEASSKDFHAALGGGRLSPNACSVKVADTADIKAVHEGVLRGIVDLMSRRCPAVLTIDVEDSIGRVDWKTIEAKVRVDSQIQNEAREAGYGPEELKLVSDTKFTSALDEGESFEDEPFGKRKEDPAALQSGRIYLRLRLDAKFESRCNSVVIVSGIKDDAWERMGATSVCLSAKVSCRRFFINPPTLLFSYTFLSFKQDPKYSELVVSFFEKSPALSEGDVQQEYLLFQCMVRTFDRIKI